MIQKNHLKILLFLTSETNLKALFIVCFILVAITMPVECLKKKNRKVML